ncbi:MAG: NUDIX domain-containing protein [Streptococcaceae bacterium]|jgi:8-oxo-dGTP pyrophosphatase MutT (NUDIX family)|nr:NUDIX domain-containing protein [Streptococcaceae bacterium]
MTNQVEAFDVHRKKHLLNIGELSLSIHVYGVVTKKDKVLILPEYGGYGFPGGTLEIGETHYETLIREFHEETGLDINPIKLLRIYDSFFCDEAYKIKDQSLLIFYLVEIIGGKISTKGFDEAEKIYAKRPEWKSLSELRKMHHACNIDIAKELLSFVETEIESQNDYNK